MKQNNPKTCKTTMNAGKGKQATAVVYEGKNIFKRYWYWRKERKRIQNEKKKKPQTFGAVLWSWTKTLVGAIIVVMFINGLLIASFVVPTGSMENTVMTGDFLFVNKFIYGPSTPQVIPFLNVPLPFFRFPGIARPEKNDVIVFIYPGGLNELEPAEFQYYLKRCVAVGGDTIRIIDKKLYVNGIPFPDPPNINMAPGPDLADTNTTFPAHIQEWTMNNYGPLVVPKTGDTIRLDHNSLFGWYIFIAREGHSVKEQDGKIYIDGKESTYYIVQRDYVFGMGDHRNNSEDSRAWGFIPEENVVGTPIMVYWSWNPEIALSDFFKKIGSIRWSRIGTLID